LLNILPEPIAERLKRGESTIADYCEKATVLFADLVDFTTFSARMSPFELVTLLNRIFSLFDELVEKHGLEKIKTIGDAYMIVGGLPEPRGDQGEAVAEIALAMRERITRLSTEIDYPLNIRIGIARGPVVAGIIGTKKFRASVQNQHNRPKIRFTIGPRTECLP
jgi:class 3 adenylate cyclase